MYQCSLDDQPGLFRARRDQLVEDQLVEDRRSQFRFQDSLSRGAGARSDGRDEFIIIHYHQVSINLDKILPRHLSADRLL